MANEKRMIEQKQLEKQIKEIFKDNPVVMGIMLRWIRKQPKADAVEVVHGRWIPTYHTYYNRDGAYQIADEWHCSKCEIYSRHEWNYCPNCGAKMDGERREGE